MVSKLMKGVFHDRPPLPKYTVTWNVQTVLTYFESVGGNSNLTLTQLTYKTVMLLALTRPTRSADLSQMSSQGCHFSPEGVKIFPSALAKQSRQGKTIKPFFSRIFSENNLICPVTTLRAYIARTLPLRADETKLFVATIKHTRQWVASSTIARWLKKLLEVAGIDVSTFKAHSVRGASASTASNMGITTSEIIEAADWSSESVFQQFYYKSTQNSSHGKAVLQSATPD